MRKNFTKTINLSEALTRLFTDEVPGHYYEFMITSNDTDRKTFFGKTYTDEGFKYWVHQDFCPCFWFFDKDLFLVELFSEDSISVDGNTKKYVVREQED